MRFNGLQSSPSRREIERITFLGHFGAGNLGNECTLQAAIERALGRWPEATLQCACSDPGDVTLRHKIAAFHWKPDPKPWSDTEQTQKVAPRWRLSTLLRASRRMINEFAHAAACIRILSRSDMLIVCGTGVVCDYLTGPGGWPYDLFKWSTLAALCGGRVLYLGVGVGPINHRLSRWLIKRALGSADYRSYRDDASSRYMETIGFRTKDDVICPDMAFGLSGNLFRPIKDRARERPVIGLGLKGLPDSTEKETYQTYVGTMADFAGWLCEQGFDVQLLIGDIRHDTRVTEDVADAIKARYNPGKRVAAEPALTVEQLMHQLDGADLVISPRFHNLVLASVLDKPIIALSDHPKLDSLMAGFGLPEYCLPLETSNLESLTAAFQRSWQDAERIKACIRAKVETYREALDEQYAAAFARAERTRGRAIVRISEVSGN